MFKIHLFQHTAARRRLAIGQIRVDYINNVSTHSRPKAAGQGGTSGSGGQGGFNTQPPEGGWAIFSFKAFNNFRFNTQPPEGGWGSLTQLTLFKNPFQHTAARRRLGRRLL